MKKSTLLLLTVFAVLLFAVFVRLSETPERGISRLSLGTMDSTKATKLEISGKNAVTLHKDEDIWKLDNGLLADEKVVTRALQALAEINSSDLVTRNAERYAELKVDAEGGVGVKAYGGSQVLASIVVGDGVSGGSYVRVDDAVYRVKGVSSHTFAKPASGWQERTLFSVDIKRVDRVEVSLAGETPYALVLRDNRWEIADQSVLPAGFRYDSDQARGLVAGLVQLKAEEILAKDPGEETTKLAAGADVLRFHVGAPTEADKAATGEVEGMRALTLGAVFGDKNQRYGRIAGRDGVFVLSSQALRTLRRSATDLRDLHVMSLKASDVVGLSLEEGSGHLELAKTGSDWRVVRTSESVPDDFSLDSAAVDRFVSTLAGVQAQSLAKTQNGSLRAMGLDKGARTVTAITKDGVRAILRLGDVVTEDERKFVYATGNADKAVYLVGEWQAKRFGAKLATFKKKAASAGLEGVDAKTLSGLPPDVRRSLQQQIAHEGAQQQMLQKLQAHKDAKLKPERRSKP